MEGDDDDDDDDDDSGDGNSDGDDAARALPEPRSPSSPGQLKEPGQNSPPLLFLSQILTR